MNVKNGGYCDQLCTNTIGSYVCSCYSGYELQDKSRCVAPNSTLLKIYFAHDRSVWRMDSFGQNQVLVANTTAASGLDYHYNKNLLYWTDTKTRKVTHFLFFRFTLFYCFRFQYFMFFLSF